MPRFTSLTSVISNQILKMVPNTKMPDGSATHSYTGNIPLATEYNIQKSTEAFRWGVSTWGVDNVTSDYEPKIN